MFFYRAILFLLLLSFIYNELSAKAGEEYKIAWAQVCSCRSYYGVPHTCYYSSITDPDGSCISKCIREANQ